MKGFHDPSKLNDLRIKSETFSRICQEVLIKHIIKLRKLGKGPTNHENQFVEMDEREGKFIPLDRA